MHFLLSMFLFYLISGLATPAMAQNGKTIVPQSQAQVNLSFAPLVKQVAPAVVNIYTTRTVVQRYGHPFFSDPFFREFFGGNVPGAPGGLMRERVQGALGSGVIVSPEGLVVTNTHVVKGAEEIKTVLADGREFEAQLVLKDEPSDLALLRIKGAKADMPFARLRSSENLQVGDLVLAIGNPFGVGQTVTSGIVSAVARSSLDINDYNFFIQTDAAINPGNSGGPLVAMDGGVVGINTAIYSQSGGNLGIGFAIPSEMVQSVIAAEANGNEGGVIRPWLGIQAQIVTSDIAESLGLEKPAGVLVQGLHNASPLKKAGVKVGDIILSLNGHDMRDPSEMKFRMATVKIGDDAAIRYLRNKKIIDEKVTAIVPPEDPPRDQVVLGAGPFDGATAMNINPAVVTELGNLRQDDSGVVIGKVDRARAGARFFKPGDIIISVNNIKIEKTGDLKKALNTRMAGYNIVFQRGGQTQQIVIR